MAMAPLTHQTALPSGRGFFGGGQPLPLEKARGVEWPHFVLYTQLKIGVSTSNFWPFQLADYFMALKKICRNSYLYFLRGGLLLKNLVRLVRYIFFFILPRA